MANPVGLVVEPVVLNRLGIFPESATAVLADWQRRLADLLQDQQLPETGEWASVAPSFAALASELLGWQEGDLLAASALEPPIAVRLDDYNETLTPTWVVNDPDGAPQLLVQELPAGTSFDAIPKGGDGRRQWEASPQQRLERLLKESEQPIGVLWNGVALRLVYAPRGESSGHLSFPLEPMTTVDGRPMLAALQMLLGPDRLFEGGSSATRLQPLMAASRKEQNEVSIRLAEQVLEALWILVKGFDAAGAPPAAPQHIYGGLITVLLRLVFLLYAEDEELMPVDSLYGQHYSVSGLALRLRQDRAEHQNQMEGRRGAWAGLLSLFRLVYDGGGATAAYLPARHGELFDPDAYPFLEGRSLGSHYKDDPIEAVPAISDDVVEQVLTKLLVLGGQILNYRALDVEQIGSVYEGIMGFAVERASGPSLGISHRPPRQKITITVVVNAEQLLAQAGSKRANWLDEQAGVKLKLAPQIARSLKEASNDDELAAALGNRLSAHTPRLLPAGSLILQPTEERRRSGSHYTPRALTEPIVAEALRPWLERCNGKPTAEQVLALKLCDPAMGSGAFLVALCRYLARALVAAWEDPDGPGFPPEFKKEWDKDLYARRLIAQRCLYGVDKNPFAVNLAKLSLWLVTLSKDLPFTFVDHALKCGDSLVGYGVRDIQAAMKEVQLGFLNHQNQIYAEMGLARRESFSADSRDDEAYDLKRKLLDQQIKASEGLRTAGDLMVAAFFAEKTPKERSKALQLNLSKISGNFHDHELPAEVHRIRERLATGDKGITPFHWDLEFPEVFSSERGGFDVFVGNPPFAGKNTIAEGSPDGFLDWFKQLHPESHGNADLVAHFFRRCFSLLRPGGSLGLIATNTIAQGDTRSTGLRWICLNGGTIYAARKRYKWPGVAAVVVSVVHLFKGAYAGVKLLEKRPVAQITAFLFANGGHDDPKQLAANAGKSFQGSIVLGMGFTFDDSGPADDDTPGIPSPIATMERLIAENTKNTEVIFPYIGGEEMNSSPTHAHHRYVINFGERSEEECRREWPVLMAIVEKKVKPDRLAQNREIRARYWWRFGETCPALYSSIESHERVLVTGAAATQHLTFPFILTGQVFSHKLIVFPLDTADAFCLLISRVHTIFANFFSSTLEDRLTYNPSDCFETFPFPTSLLDANANDPAHEATRQSLETIGERYHQFRAELMVRNNEGLTSTYNRFHDPAETSSGLLELRRLHGEMDQAVLNAYGWSDVPTACGFGLDYLDSEEDAQLPDELQERIDSGELFFWEAGDALDFQGQLQAYGAITGRRKLPWRYRWPDALRDDVLARLLALNAERYEEEVNLGLHSKGAKQAAKASRAAGASGAAATGKRRGRPPKTVQLGETEPTQTEQMGLGL
jgi:hypothetical protein